jgi:glycosyltransferase involved in cell wall biosynthesis
MELPTRVCLITPGHLSTNPRIVKEADALGEAGCEVGVISADYLGWAREADASFIDRPWRSVAKVRFGPDAPRADYFRQTVRRRTARGLARAVGPWPALAERAVHPASSELRAAAIRNPADLYIAHYTAALPAAAAAAKANGAAYAFDAEDYHLGDLPDGEAHAFDRRLIEKVEARLLPGCSHMTAASPGIAEAYSEHYGLRLPTVVLNVFPRSLAVSAPTTAGTASPGPSLFWFSQTIGPHRGLEIALEAIAISAAKPALWLLGSPARGYERSLRAKAGRLGIDDRVNILPPVPPSELVRVAAQFDLGLAGEIGDTPNHRIALANKLFTYLLAGVPTLASDIPAHVRLGDLGDAVSLYRALDPASFAEKIDYVLRDPRRLADARRSAWRLGQQRFNWDVEKAKLLAAVASGATLSSTRAATA